MNHEILFYTGAASLAIFDPQVLAARLSDDCDWWCENDLSRVKEVRDGKIALICMGGDGGFKVRVTDGPLLESERAYASVRLPLLGLEVVSGRVFVGAAEHLPGDGMPCDPADEELASSFIPLPNGVYDVQAYGINWGDASEWYVDAESPVPETAPADIVAVIRPRVQRFTAPTEDPRFDGIEDDWLYPELPRQRGPRPGMVLTTTVVRRLFSLLLRPAGPLGYRPVLADMKGLRQGDVIKVKVLSVDDAKEEMAVERVGIP